jgi:hypothetical protein
MKPILIKRKKNLRRIPIGFLIIGFFALSPFLIGILGGEVSEFFTGRAVNEGNSIWGVLPWLTVYTAPIGVVVAVVFLMILGFDALILLFGRKN